MAGSGWGGVGSGWDQNRVVGSDGEWLESGWGGIRIGWIRMGWGGVRMGWWD